MLEGDEAALIASRCRASSPRRAAAVLLDLAVSLVIGIGMWPTTRHRSELQRRLAAVAARGTYVIWSTATFGGTPGQLVMGLQGVDAKTDRKVCWEMAAQRWAIEAVPSLLVSMWLRASVGKIVDRMGRRTERLWGRASDEASADENLSPDGRRSALDEELLNPGSRNQHLGLVAASVAYLAYSVYGGPRIRDRLTNTVVVNRTIGTLQFSCCFSRFQRPSPGSWPWDTTVSPRQH